MLRIVLSTCFFIALGSILAFPGGVLLLLGTVLPNATDVHQTAVVAKKLIAVGIAAVYLALIFFFFLVYLPPSRFKKRGEG